MGANRAQTEGAEKTEAVCVVKWNIVSLRRGAQTSPNLPEPPRTARELESLKHLRISPDTSARFLGPLAAVEAGVVSLKRRWWAAA